MQFEPDFVTDNVVGIPRIEKSSYLENYQKYIDEFCTPPHYKKQPTQPTSIKDLSFEQIVEKMM